MDNARLFVDFTVSRDVQRLVEEVLFRRTVRNDLQEYRTEEENRMRVIDYDVPWVVEEKENILKTWGEIQNKDKQK